MDKENILGILEEGVRSLSFQFKEVSDKFKIIDGDMISIIIPWNDNCKNLLKQARNGNITRSMSRNLQPYVVQVYEKDYDNYDMKGYIENIGGIYTVLNNSKSYSEKVGLLPTE